MSAQNRLGASLCGLAFLALSCGGLSSTKTIPTLPGDGDANTDKPRAVVEDRPTDQPWGDPDKLIRLPDPAPAEPLKLPATETFTLKNGLEVILVADRNAPVTSFQLAIKAGRERTKRDTVGLARLTAVLTTRGTRTRNAATIVKTIEAANGDLTADASYEATLLSCNSVSSKHSSCAQVLADMAANATFPTPAFEELRARLKDSATQRVRDASSLAAAHFQNLLWGPDHPRGWPSSQRSIGAIKRTDVLAWYRAYYRPNNAILAVAGDFDPAAMKASLTRTFGRWARSKVAPVSEKKAPAQQGIRVRVVDKPDEAITQIRLGQLGLAESDEDYMPAVVVNAILGGQPMNSRLEKSVAGLGEFALRSQLDSNRALGSWVVSAAVPGQDAVAVVQRVRDALGALKRDGVTDEEVKLASSFVSGSYAVRFQSASDVAGAVLAARLHGRKLADVASYPVRAGAVTTAKATAAAKSRLNPENLVVVLVGNAGQLVPALQRAGWKFEITSYIEPIAPWDRKASESEGRAILAKALKAKGGEKALKELKTFTWKGKAILSADKRTANVEKRFSAPNQLRLDMEIPSEKTTISTVMDGDTGWAAQKGPAGQRVIPFPAGEVEAGKAQIWRDQDLVLLRHLESGSDVALVDEIVVDKKPAWAVRIISPKKQYSVVLYIVKATGLLAGMTYQERGPQGVIVAEERYGSYKRVKGIQFAHTRITRSGQLDLKTELKTVEVNGTIDASVFAKPAQ